MFCPGLVKEKCAASFFNLKKPRKHITLICSALSWLPQRAIIDSKDLLLVCEALNGLEPDNRIWFFNTGRICLELKEIQTLNVLRYLILYILY